MSYKGYSFNLHKEDDKELIDWLINKKVTQTIKIALRNHMKSEDNKIADDNSIELLSAIKKVIENSSGDINNTQSAIIGNQDVVIKQSDNKKSLSIEDVEDFEKIFDL